MGLQIGNKIMGEKEYFVIAESDAVKFRTSTTERFIRTNIVVPTHAKLNESPISKSVGV